MIIQALIYPNFTTLDLIGALQPLSFIPGAEVEIVAKQTGQIPTDCGAPLVATHSFVTASKGPDVLLVPGGGESSISAIEDEDTVAFVMQQGNRAKWIVGVCTGSLLLGQAGLLKGYKASTHWGVIDDLHKFGAQTRHERVVIDGNRCTGGGVTAGVDIGLTVAGLLAGQDAGKLIELVLEYNPQPPFGTGHPSIADSEILAMAREQTSHQFQKERLNRAIENRHY